MLGYPSACMAVRITVVRLNVLCVVCKVILNLHIKEQIILVRYNEFRSLKYQSYNVFKYLTHFVQIYRYIRCVITLVATWYRNNVIWRITGLGPGAQNLRVSRQLVSQSQAIRLQFRIEFLGKYSLNRFLIGKDQLFGVSYDFLHPASAD